MASKPTYEDLEQRVRELEGEALAHEEVRAALRKSEAKYRNIYDHAQVGIFRTRLSDGKVLECNNRFAQTYGFDSAEECMTDYVLAEHYVDPGTRKQMLMQLEKFGEIRGFEARFYRKDGKIVWIRFSALAYRREGFLEGFAYDITHEKNAIENLRVSEEKYRTILESIEDGYFEVNLAGDFTFFNNAMCTMMGYSREELLGKGNREYMDAEIAGKVFQKFNQVYRTGKSARGMDWELIKKDGSRFVVETSVSLITTSKGRPIGFRGIARDVTLAKEAQRALEISESKFKSFSEQSLVGIYLIQDGVFQYVNPKFAEIFGYSTEECMGKPFQEMVFPEDFEMVGKQVQKRISGEVSSVRYVFRGVRKNGEIIDLEIYGASFPYRGRPAAIGTMLDITEHRHAEKALRESEERYKLLSDASFEAIFLSERGVCIGQNKTAERMFGYTEAEALGRMGTDWIYHEDRDIVRKKMLSGFEKPYEVRGLRKDGSTFPCEIQGRMASGGGRTLRVTALRDITGRKQAEEALQAAEETYRNLFLNSQVGLFRTGVHSGMLLDANNAVARFFGFADREEMLSKPFSIADRYVNPQDREKMLRLLETHGEFRESEAPFRKNDGTIVWFRYSGRLVAEKGWIEGVSQDITDDIRAQQEREKLQAQFNQAQKMESVGRLAGGVAHDFNNMLSVILGHTDMGLMQVNPESPLHRRLMQIRETARRSADLVRQLLAFARKQTIEPRVLDLNHTVGGMIEMVRRLIGEDIHLAWLPGKNLWPIKMDPSQIDQILANLCVNARDAIAGVGKVIIQTKNAVLDEAYCAGHPGATPGEYVVLTISDDGCGMGKKVLDNLFEPFFTTKDVGKGTGLGLPMVYGIVKQNDGFIQVYSEPGHGSTFQIHLPRHASEEERTREEPVPQSPRGGNETVLLVEDEPMLLEMGKEMLERLGYRVLTAQHPDKAVIMAQSYGGQIHLLMTDVIMPEMNGRDLARKLQSLQPKLKCLFMSGYTADVIAHRGVLDEGVHFIQKPFSMANLSTVIREILSP